MSNANSNAYLMFLVTQIILKKRTNKTEL